MTDTDIEEQEEQSARLFREEMAQLREDIAVLHASIAQDRKIRREWASAEGNP